MIDYKAMRCEAQEAIMSLYQNPELKNMLARCVEPPPAVEPPVTTDAAAPVATPRGESGGDDAAAN